MTFDEATKAKGPGQTVVGVRAIDGTWSYGVAPLEIEDQPNPFLDEEHWRRVGAEAQRRVSA